MSTKEKSFYCDYEKCKWSNKCARFQEIPERGVISVLMHQFLDFYEDGKCELYEPFVHPDYKTGCVCHN